MRKTGELKKGLSRCECGNPATIIREDEETHCVLALCKECAARKSASLRDASAL